MPPIRSKPAGQPKPFWETTDRTTVQLFAGDVRARLRDLPSKSVQCVMTSPPYWGLRDYKTGSPNEIGREPSPDCGTNGQAQCGRCFVCSMVGVFREVRRVLRDDGALWLNLGDSYGGGTTGGYSDKSTLAGFTNPNTKGRRMNRDQSNASVVRSGLLSGNLVGVPWRVALALQADGWVLRQDIIWHKPSPMPESVRNRCTKAHEYLFLLTKHGSRYYYDVEAIKEKSSEGRAGEKPSNTTLNPDRKDGANRQGEYPVMSNKRSVWTIAAEGFKGAHFATFPMRLVRPVLLAGTSAHGACAKCGTPWTRVVRKRKLTRERPNDYVKRTGEEGTGNSCPNSAAGVEVVTVGWGPGCLCRTDDVVPCRVLDPFVGSGTVCVVALELGLRSWGIDLNEDYLRDFAVSRIEGALLSRPSTIALIDRELTPTQW